METPEESHYVTTLPIRLPGSFSTGKHFNEALIKSAGFFKKIMLD